MTSERAETERFGPFLERIGVALDRFLRFEQPDAMHDPAAWQTVLGRPLPEEGIGAHGVLDELTEAVIPNGGAIARPEFSGYITTGATNLAALAGLAGAVAAPQRYSLTAFNLLEEVSLDWLAEMFRLEGMKGVYSSGGSVANLIALGGARQAAFEKIGRDPAADGVDRAGRIYASDQCHHTIQRSAGVLGLGRRAVRVIASGADGRMNVPALVAALDEDQTAGLLPVAIVANAGTTNTGAIDPIAEIGAIARARGIWLHVDGAYGLPGRLDPRTAPLYRGLELADSVIVDPHKWLGAPVGIAATFVRDRELLGRAFTQEPADYLEGSVETAADGSNAPAHSLDSFGIPYFDYSVELSAPSRGVVVWAMLREIGVAGMRARIVRHNDMARAVAHFADQHARLEVLLAPTLSVCCFRYLGPPGTDQDALNWRIYRQLLHENTYMPSSTRVGGKLALRPCFIGARAERDQVPGLMAAVLRIGGALVAQGDA